MEISPSWRIIEVGGNMFKCNECGKAALSAELIAHSHNWRVAYGGGGGGGGISRTSGAGVLVSAGWGGGVNGPDAYGGGGSPSVESITYGPATPGYAGNSEDGESKAHWKARAILAERELAKLKGAT